jgi:hypothetical protein
MWVRKDCQYKGKNALGFQLGALESCRTATVCTETIKLCHKKFSFWKFSQSNSKWLKTTFGYKFTCYLFHGVSVEYIFLFLRLLSKAVKKLEANIVRIKKKIKRSSFFQFFFSLIKQSLFKITGVVLGFVLGILLRPLQLSEVFVLSNPIRLKWLILYINIAKSVIYILLDELVPYLHYLFEM